MKVFLVAALDSVTDLSDDFLHLSLLLCCTLLIRHQLLEMSCRTQTSSCDSNLADHRVKCKKLTLISFYLQCKNELETYQQDDRHLFKSRFKMSKCQLDISQIGHNIFKCHHIISF